MNKEPLFAFLEEQDSPTLLNFLEAAYEEMSTEQRWSVFGKALKKAKPLRVQGKSLLEDVEDFQRDSLAGSYYAPFDINSKNFMHVPEETRAWFERIGDLLADSMRLSEQGDHAHAVACFRILYQLVDVMESGDEIVFADEYGSWMIPGDKKKAHPAEALAAERCPGSRMPLLRSTTRGRKIARLALRRLRTFRAIGTRGEQRRGIVLPRHEESQGRIANPSYRKAGSCSCANPYFTSSTKLSEWLPNSGAYMHSTEAMPVWYRPRCTTRVEYSKTYVPLGR